MQILPLTPARERRLARANADVIQRTVVALHLALDDLPVNEALVALLVVLQEKRREPHDREVCISRAASAVRL